MNTCGTYEIFGVVDSTMMKFSFHIKRIVGCRLVTPYHRTWMDMTSDKWKESSRISSFYLKKPDPTRFIYALIVFNALNQSEYPKTRYSHSIIPVLWIVSTLFILRHSPLSAIGIFLSS
ncbi:hypothetical protein RF11_14642 [Thelohanellus kitauei]|uniref:Uncharacterized protein n=1 Tax=Thelohanellus kitauei TaxID=669202 RepID=A0A0C2J4M8_THEKT|nr:hypothetical protein RF11_14642 [Thelohanellus kitauei]